MIKGQCRYCQTTDVPKPTATLCPSSACLWSFYRDNNYEKFIGQPVKPPPKRDVVTELDRLKDKDYLAKAVTKYVHTLIHYRDKDQRCISCNGDLSNRDGRGVHAGHYRESGRYPRLRYYPNNIHLQCFTCNRKRAGNLINYRLGLIKRYGIGYVEQLEHHENADTYSWTAVRLKPLWEAYRADLRELGLALPSI